LNTDTCPTNGSATVRGVRRQVGALGGARHPQGRGPRRGDLAQQVGQPVDPHAGRRRHHQHRHGLAVADLAGQRAHQLGRCGLVAGQVPLQLLVVVGDDLLGDLVVQPVLLGRDVGGHRAGSAVPVAVVVQRLVGQHVGHPVQRLLLAERQLQRHDGLRGRAAAPGQVPHLGEHPVEVGAGAVLLGDQHDAADPCLVAAPPHRLGAGLHAVHRAHHDHREVRHAERRVHPAGEVGCARGVEQGEPVGRAAATGPVQVGDPERDGGAAGDLLRLVVADGRAVLDPAGAGDRPGAEQQGLCQCRLAGTAVTDEGHAADRRRRCRVHPGLLVFAWVPSG
jgi:hypothetical protein